MSAVYVVAITVSLVVGIVLAINLSGDDHSLVSALLGAALGMVVSLWVFVMAMRYPVLAATVLILGIVGWIIARIVKR